MGKIDYGDSGIAKLVLIDEKGETERSLGELADNENILNSVRPTLRVELTAEAVEALGGEKELKKRGQVKVRQLFRGAELPEAAVKEKNGQRFHLTKGLFRGRNDLVVQVGDREEFSFPVFQRSLPAEWLESLLKALILVVVVKTFVVQAFFIPTGSMEDTLYPSDYILVEKVTTLFERPERGDIFVFQYPEDPTKDFIKRKVADQGDVIAMKMKRFYIDDQCVDEVDYAVYKSPEVYPPGVRHLGAIRDNIPRMEIPEAHSWAMGDNRDNSQDSRFWGPLPDYRVKGRALAIYWPLSRMGAIRPRFGELRPMGSCHDLVTVAPPPEPGG